MDVQAAPTSWLLETALPRILGHLRLFDLWFSLCICPGVELPGHVAQGTLLNALRWPESERNPQRVEIQAYVRLIHFPVWQTLAQHCKATTYWKKQTKKIHPSESKPHGLYTTPTLCHYTAPFLKEYNYEDNKMHVIVVFFPKHPDVFKNSGKLESMGSQCCRHLFQYKPAHHSFWLSSLSYKNPIQHHQV